jgi:hypothetical protein
VAANLQMLDALLKNVYLPGLPDFINKRRPILDRIEKITKKERFKGRKFIFAAKDADGQSTAWLNEGQTLPTGDNATPLNMELAMKYHYAVARLSGQVVDASTSDSGAFEEAVQFEMDSKRNQIADDVAVNAVYGTGNGELGQAASYAQPTVTMQTQPTVGGIGANLIRKGMKVRIYSALSGGSERGNGESVVAVNRSAGTFTLNANIGAVAANDYVFRTSETGAAVDDPRGKAMMGLGGLIDDATRVGTIQNLSRTTFPSLKANVLGNAGTLRAITEELIDQLCAEASQNGGGGYPTALYSQLAIQRRIAAYLRADRNYDMFASSGKVLGGYTAVMWKAPGIPKAIPWFDDLFVRPNEVLAVCEPDLFQAIQVDTTVVREDGSMFRFTDRKDEVEVWFRTWRNLGSRQFNNHSVLRDISHTA